MPITSSREYANIAKLFQELQQSYQLMVSTPNPSSTTVKQNMVTMREFHENLVTLMRKETRLTDAQINNAVAMKAPNSTHNYIDTFSVITALNYYGFVPANLADAMHSIRKYGNDAAHYSAVDNGKPNMLRGKTPEQMRNYAIEMYKNILTVWNFATTQFNPAPAVASSSKKAVKNGGQGNKKQSLPFVGFVRVFGIVGVFSTIIALISESEYLLTLGAFCLSIWMISVIIYLILLAGMSKKNKTQVAPATTMQMPVAPTPAVQTPVAPTPVVQTPTVQAPTVQAPVPELYILKCVSGALAGKMWEVSAKPLTIGRNPETCTIVLPAETNGASRTHCQVFMINDKVQLKDCGATYGTKLANGNTLNNNMMVELSKGEKFTIGESEIFEVDKK